ncbi:MAG: GAF domain-containing protein [Acidobacteriota bacterium]
MLTKAQQQLEFQGIRTEAARYRTLLEINNAIVSNLKQDHLFQAISVTLQRVLPFDRAAIFLHERESNVFRLFALTSSSPTPHFAIGYEIAAEESHMGWAFEHRRYFLRHDLSQERRYQTEHLLFEEGIRSIMSVPLVANGRSIGTLNLASMHANQYTEVDAQFLQEVANQIALAIENMRAYERIEALNSRLQTPAERYRILLEINNAIITNLTQADLFQAICTVLKKSVPFDRAGLTLYEPAIEALRVFALVGEVNRFMVGQALPLTDPQTGQKLDFQRTRLFRDLETERNHPIDHLIYAEGIRSYCAVPLTLRGVAIGTIGVGSFTKSQYSESDADFLLEVANQVALAVANMRSYEEIRALSAKEGAAAERHRTLLEINNAVITSLTQEDLLRACRTLQRVIRFDLAAVSFYEEELDALRFFALEGASAAEYVTNQMLYRHDNGSGQTLAFEQPLVLPDLENALQFNFVRQLHADGFRSFCAAPLIVEGKLVGALGIISKSRNQYGVADLEFLQEVGNQIALAVANMKAFQQIRSLSAREAESAQRRRTLLEINNAIITNLRQEDLFRSVFSALQPAIPFSKVGLTFYDPESDGLRFFALEGNSSQHFSLGKVLDRKDCCFGRAFDTQQAVLCRDLEQEQRYDTDRYLLAEGQRSYCTVPLIVQGKSIGAMSVVSTECNRYSEADAVFLQEVANQVALAVTNMKSFEEIAALKARLQAENLSLQETAALMGRFAAALSHELNSPLGALKSAIQSSQTLALQKAQLPPHKRDRAEELECKLRSTVADSVERLHQVVLRMQRFTNLDRTEVLAVDVNSLLQDAVLLLDSQAKGRIRVELELNPLPPVVVRPQQLSSVFLNVLQNALEESNESRCVFLASRQVGTEIQITIRDDGKGMDSEEAAKLFEPAFKVKAGRVTASNWSLFSSRQIIQEHGGQIEIQSAVGKGTIVRVMLPC